MGRLIDADELISVMDKRYKEKNGNVPDNLAEGFMQMEKLIKEQPTAYDVDKVIAELEEQKYENPTIWIQSFKNKITDMFIEIVRKGGVDHDR